MQTIRSYFSIHERIYVFLFIYDYKCYLSIWAFVCTDRDANTSFYKDITSLVILELSSSLPGRMRRSYQIWAVAMRILPRSRCTNWGSNFGLIERMWKGNKQIMAQDVHWNPWLGILYKSISLKFTYIYIYIYCTCLDTNMNHTHNILSNIYLDLAWLSW